MPKFPALSGWWTSLQAPADGRRNLLEEGIVDPLFTERIKGLRAKFEYKSGMLKYRLVGITSSVSGEGKTMIGAHLATNLSITGRHKVLLVDADIRKADMTRGLSIPRHPGLTEYLTGSATLREIVRDSHNSALKVIATGTEVNSPADLLSGDAFREFLKAVREQYDIVIVDTTPVIPVADTITMRELLDGFVFIYRASYTPISLFRQATEEIGKEKILGVVINGVDPEKLRTLNKYYGYYYHKDATGKQAG